MRYRLHFRTTFNILGHYDAPKTINKNNYEKREDREIFSTWNFKSVNECQKFCIFNFVKSENWLYNKQSDAWDVYYEKMKYFSTFKENINKDYETIKLLLRTKNISFNEITKQTKSGGRPPILQLLFQDHISIEFVCIVNNKFTFADKWNTIDPLIVDAAFLIKKYSPLINIIRHGQKVA
jgi:hypothetical protein